MGMLSYAEKNVFSIGKSGEKGDNKDKEESLSDDPLKTKLSLYKTRCLLMMKSMKSSKREIKALITAHPMVYNNVVD